MNQKGFALIAIILIVIGVLALGGGALYVKEKKKTEEIKKQAEKLAQNKNQQEQNQQTATTSDETKDWKTYRNEQYGFEVKYPPHMVAGVEAKNSVLGTTSNLIGGIYIGPYVFIIADNNKLKGVVLKEYNNLLGVVDRTQNFEKNYKEKAINESEDMAQGEGGACFIETIPNNQVFIQLFQCGPQGIYGFIKSEKYDIFVDGYSHGWEDLGAARKIINIGFSEEEAQKILSTFKFIP